MFKRLSISETTKPIVIMITYVQRIIFIYFVLSYRLDHRKRWAKQNTQQFGWPSWRSVHVN